MQKKVDFKHMLKDLFWMVWWNTPWCVLTRRKYVSKARRTFDYEKNKGISIIASNCLGGELYSVLGLKFTSPFINCSVERNEFVIMASSFKDYMEGELKNFFYNKRNELACQLVAKKDLPPICIAWPHDNDIDKVISNFEKRKARINYEKLVFLTDSTGLSDEDFEIFSKIPAYKKAIITGKDDHRNGDYVEKLKADSSRGLNYKKLTGIFRFQQMWNFVKWFNE